MAKALALIALVIGTFLYGVAVGFYELPPFGALKSVMQKLKIELPFSKAISPQEYGGARSNRREAFVAVVMLGDSLTARGPWNELFPASRILNEGIDGDTTLGVLNRINSIVHAKPRSVFLMIGVNDFIRNVPVEMVEGRIRLIALTLRANGIVPVIQSILHVSERESEINRKVKALNAALRSWCEAEGIMFLDLNSRLSSNEALLPKYSPDGLHLNAEAYAVWGRVIRPYVHAKSDMTRGGQDR